MIADSFGFARNLSLVVESEDPAAIRFYRQEYGWTGSPPKGPPTVELKWSRAALPEGQPEAGTYHAHKLLARWRYRLNLGNPTVEVEARGNRLALPMVHHMLVHPGLRLRACRQGVLLLHGAALVHQGRTVILTGAGGAGKTTTTSLLLAHGGPEWQLHADDYVFLSEQGDTYPYLTRAHLYLDLLEAVPSVGRRLTNRERARVEVFGRLRRWSRDGVKWPVRIELRRLWPNRRVADTGRLAALFVLRRDGETASTRPLADPERAIEQLLDMNFREARHYRTLLAKDSSAGEADPLIGRWRARERSILQAVWPQALVAELALPSGLAPAAAAAAVESAILATLKQEARPAE